jgi:hypothetical protein
LDFLSVRYLLQSPKYEEHRKTQKQQGNRPHFSLSQSRLVKVGQTKTAAGHPSRIGASSAHAVRNLQQPLAESLRILIHGNR